MLVDKEKFAQRFKQSREIMDMTQKELAAMLHVKRSTVGSWETAYRLPEIQKAQKAADIFNVRLDWLLGKSDNQQELSQTADPETLKEFEKIQKEMKELSNRFNRAIEKQLTKRGNKS